jgi:hypothetical protein
MGSETKGTGDQETPSWKEPGLSDPVHWTKQKKKHLVRERERERERERGGIQSFLVLYF